MLDLCAQCTVNMHIAQLALVRSCLPSTQWIYLFVDVRVKNIIPLDPKTKMFITITHFSIHNIVHTDCSITRFFGVYIPLLQAFSRFFWIISLYLHSFGLLAWYIFLFSCGFFPFISILCFLHSLSLPVSYILAWILEKSIVPPSTSKDNNNNDDELKREIPNAFVRDERNVVVVFVAFSKSIYRDLVNWSQSKLHPYCLTNE